MRIRKLNEMLDQSDFDKIKQHYIDIIQDKIDHLNRDLKVTKQGLDYYDKIHEKITLLEEVLSDFEDPHYGDWM